MNLRAAAQPVWTSVATSSESAAAESSWGAALGSSPWFVPELRVAAELSASEASPRSTGGIRANLESVISTEFHSLSATMEISAGVAERLHVGFRAAGLTPIAAPHSAEGVTGAPALPLHRMEVFGRVVDFPGYSADAILVDQSVAAVADLSYDISSAFQATVRVGCGSGRSLHPVRRVAHGIRVGGGIALAFALGGVAAGVELGVSDSGLPILEIIAR
jgi:hypothetical protein